MALYYSYADLPVFILKLLSADSDDMLILSCMPSHIKSVACCLYFIFRISACKLNCPAGTITAFLLNYMILKKYTVYIKHIPTCCR